MKILPLIDRVTSFLAQVAPIRKRLAEATRVSASSAPRRTGDRSRGTGDSHGRPDDQNDVVAQITEEFGEATRRAAETHLARGDSVFGIVDGKLVELGRAEKRR
ncbi:MAG: hypothetical protein H0U97_11295 [Gammaproteobacteria bacterium]|nr:hypothetical protein [Gammaproteobacteria bacterium]